MISFEDYIEACERLHKAEERELELYRLEYYKKPVWLMHSIVSSDIELTPYNMWQYAYQVGHEWVHKDTGKHLEYNDTEITDFNYETSSL